MSMSNKISIFCYFIFREWAFTNVSKIILVAKYGSILAPGLLSSKYPHLFLTTSFGMRIEQDLSPNPYVNSSILDVSLEPVNLRLLPDPYTFKCAR